ncbi:MAG: ribosomal protein S18-alanine N-acetyltransferase [Gemmatimonadaceae bacterium]|nr:ribosomal protein S18-alanine N-acetyltransferase [Gemmatimonadaceae bacterium]
MSGCHVRPAQRADLQAILEIEREVFTDPWSPESFAPEFSDPYTWFRVLEVDGVMAGYIVARIVARQGEIANIAVAQAHRGAGLGGVLLDAAVAAAEAAECEAVWLEVRVTNEPAIRLYTSRRFELIGRRKGYYRSPVEDALVLRRTRAAAAVAAEK